MSKLHDNPFRPDYDAGAPEPAPQSQYIKGLDMAQDMRRKTPRTDDLRRELEALPKYGQYGYNAEAFAALIFKRYTQLERELSAANAQIEVLLEARDTRYPYYEQVGPVHVVCKCPKCADKDAARIFFRDQAEALRRQLDDQSNELSDARAGERKLIVENESLRAHYGLEPKS